MEGMLNYFIPEDGDSSDHMNVVPLPRVDQLRLQHIKKCFPLPGEFHFRFKTAFEGTYVWLDVTNENEPIPDYNGLIISKIARIQRESATRPAERVDSSVASKHAQDKGAQPHHPQQQQVPTPDLFETESSPTKQDEKPRTTSKGLNDDLVGLLGDPIQPTTTPAHAPTTGAPTTSQPSGGPPDPFNLFMGGAAAPSMRPPPGASHPPHMNLSKGPQQNPNAFSTGQFSPMGSNPNAMGNRPPGNMNISQMGAHMTQPGSGSGVGMQGGNSAGSTGSFQGLQWQGMGAPMGMPPHNQQPRPKW